MSTNKKYAVAMAILVLGILLVRPLRQTLGMLWENAWYFLVLLPGIWLILYGGGISLICGFVDYYAIQQSFFYLFGAVAAMIIAFIFDKEKLDIWIKVSLPVLIFCTVTCIKYVPGNYWESEYCMMFGAYALYFLYKRSPFWFLISLAATFVTHKRIAWAALAVCIVIMLFASLCDRSRKRGNEALLAELDSERASKYRKALLILSVLIFFGYAAACAFGLFEKIALAMGISTYGRLTAWKRIATLYEFSPLYLGKGVGFVGRTLGEWSIDYFHRLHNDISVIYIENGFLGSLVWMLSFLPLLGSVRIPGIDRCLGNEQRLMATIFCVYMLIIYMTDNALAYSGVQTVMAVLIIAVLRPEGKESQEA